MHMRPMDFSQVQILEVPESHVISDSTGRQVVAYVMAVELLELKTV